MRLWLLCQPLDKRRIDSGQFAFALGCLSEKKKAGDACIRRFLEFVSVLGVTRRGACEKLPPECEKQSFCRSLRFLLRSAKEEQRQSE